METTARAVRPIPERTGPLRSADRSLRVETAPDAAKGSASSTSPIADAVSQAYQVFDRYLKEGKEYAAGQSAWYTAPSTLTAASPTVGSLPAPTGAISPTDLLSAAMWLFEQMRAVAQTATPAVGAPAASWPRPQWPTQGAPAAVAPVANRAQSDWVEERFDDEAEDDEEGVLVSPAHHVPPPVSRSARRSIAEELGAPSLGGVGGYLDWTGR